jgi:hypothetical protein
VLTWFGCPLYEVKTEAGGGRSLLTKSRDNSALFNYRKYFKRKKLKTMEEQTERRPDNEDHGVIEELYSEEDLAKIFNASLDVPIDEDVFELVEEAFALIDREQNKQD